MTAVSHDTFVNARPVAASNVRVNAQQMQAAEVQRNLPWRPVQKSVVGAGAVANGQAAGGGHEPSSGRQGGAGAFPPLV